MKADAVFEGGGVKGIGLVGAVSEIEKAGYTFENIAGTSAGAIVASLLAVGYNAEEIKNELLKLNFNSFKDEDLIDKLGGIGKLIGAIINYGVYEGECFESWLQNLLEAKGKTTFGQLKTDYTEEKYRYRLQIIATDITDRKMLILPQDLKSFGFDPDQFSIARSVRMSMSIPIFFEPVKLVDVNKREHIIVDGGVLSNYPIWLLDDNTKNPPWPTFGFKLNEPVKRKIVKGQENNINNSLEYFLALVGTMIEAHDKMHISRLKGDYDRTIGIPTLVNINNIEKEIKTTDFDITQEESLKLFENGEIAARRFLDSWNFEEWKKKYRQQS